MVNCYVCGDPIVKYKMDLGDTVALELKFKAGKVKKTVYVCDQCCRKIAIRFIEVAITR